jgi:hypothetical protein
MGYDKLEFPLLGKTNVTVKLEQQTQDTKDVVVVGYGTAKAKELTGATSKVKGEAAAALTGIAVPDVG